MILICPVCGKKLIKKERSAVCENNHVFDYAKSGYLNLLISQKAVHGDGKDMVKARTEFLSSGAYAFLRDQLAEMTSQDEILADLGCGEGYYTRCLQGKEKYGFDLSKDALKHAARSDRSTAYTVASIFRLPLPDESCDTVLTCFAPAANEEIERILKPEGRFIYVTPGPDHLYEMKEILYENPYRNVTEDLKTGLTLTDSRMIRQTFEASQSMLQNLFMMTPYAYRTAKEDRERLSQTESLTITAEFLIRVYTKIIP